MNHYLFIDLDKEAFKLSSYYIKRLPNEIYNRISIKYYHTLTNIMIPLEFDLTNEELLEKDLLEQFGIYD